jgi:hypothetical protein
MQIIASPPPLLRERGFFCTERAFEFIFIMARKTF